MADILATGEPKLALQMVDITKKYSGTVAVSRVNFDVRFGEVHALLGENGAGKSTLMKLIAGSFNDYEGQVLLEGRPIDLHTPQIAKREGIAMIHQEINLARSQTIAENLFAGMLPTKFRFVDQKFLRKLAIDCLERVALDVDPSLRVETLSQHEQQLVEIAEALASNPRVLVMDEPTSALGRDDVERLFEIVKNLKKQGLAIIYISHHLSEVFEIADRATVLRDGKKVETKDIRDTGYEELIEMMIGRSLAQESVVRNREPGFMRVRADELTRKGFFQKVSFQVGEGEILGLFGLLGSGTTEVARSIIGADPLHSGSVTLDEKTIPQGSIEKALDAGVAYVSEDRKQEGLALRMTVAENMLSAIIPRISRRGLYSKNWGAATVKKYMEEFQVSPPDSRIEASGLSGGNQQKVLLGKWLATNPEFLILDEPTRGVDIGAKSVIHDVIGKIADAGKSVLVISSDLPELLTLCNRVLVMKDGAIQADIPRDRLSENSLLMAANGLSA